MDPLLPKQMRYRAALHTETKHGGGDRNRTRDILLAKQALSQLSYTPNETLKNWHHRQESNLYLPLRRRLFYPLNYDGKSWLRGQDSNLRLPGYEPGSLPTDVPRVISCRESYHRFTTYFLTWQQFCALPDRLRERPPDSFVWLA